MELFPDMTETLHTHMQIMQSHWKGIALRLNSLQGSLQVRITFDWYLEGFVEQTPDKSLVRAEQGRGRTQRGTHSLKRQQVRWFWRSICKAFEFVLTFLLILIEHSKFNSYIFIRLWVYFKKHGPRPTYDGCSGRVWEKAEGRPFRAFVFWAWRVGLQFLPGSHSSYLFLSWLQFPFIIHTLTSRYTNICRK